MGEFILEKNITFLSMFILNSYILYLTINLFQKLRLKTETIQELDRLRISIYIYFYVVNFRLIGSSFYFFKK